MPKSQTPRLTVLKDLFIGFSVILLLTITGLNLYLFLHKEPTVLGVQTSPLSERQYWQKVVRKNPTYRDAWVQIAKLDYEMGNHKYAEVALSRAKNIDPNSLTILDVEKTLVSQN